MNVQTGLCEAVRSILAQECSNSCMKKKEIASVSGLSRQTVSNVLTGHVSVSLSTLVCLCGGLGVKLSDVIARAEEIV